MFPRVVALVALALSPLAARAENSPLAAAPSEFARAQAGSAVHWHPWNEATLAQARVSRRSVYVFIGSPLSELTRATIAQTFTSEKTVAWINESFFCIFVDADAQPDVAALGQHFIATVKQLRGSPVHLWLTPDTLQPYDGANYLPPSEEWGKAGFLKAGRAALESWTVDPARARALASEAAEMMRLAPLELTAKVDVAAKLETAAKAWTAAADAKHGGFGAAPKLPEPELIRFLLTRDGPARDAAIAAARALVNGALRDPVDGGFYRRCIDAEWKEPYFQKTLLDQARIALALFHAADAAKDDKLRVAGIEALDFALKAMMYPDGTLVAALDGTFAENPDPAKRPNFVKVGTASTGAQGLLIAALYRSGEKRFTTAAVQLSERLARLIIACADLPHQGIDGALGTAADYNSAALAFRVLKESITADRQLVRANELYFDSATGAYMATTTHLPPGIASRVPASGDTPSAEVLALLAGVDARTTDLIRRNLLTQIEYDELPPGDILLGLSQRQK